MTGAAARRSPENDTLGPSAGRGAPAGVDAHLVALLAPSSFDAEPYRILASTVERARRGRESLVVAVTSAAPGDGKTTTAINLAATLAGRPGRACLLVDADLRRPAVGTALRLADDGGPTVLGLLDARDRRLPKLATPWTPLALSVLPAGGVSATPQEALVSDEFTALVQEARARHPYVILDTPPVVALPDTRALTDVVDGFLVVVRAGVTPKRLLAEALDALEPPKVMGLVFNGDERPLAGYYGRYRSYYAAASRPSGQGTR